MKTRVMCFVCLVVGFFIMRCKNTPPTISAAAMSAISVSDLLKDPERWNGQMVRVMGFYYFEAPSSVLFESRGVFMAKNTELCLWIGKDCPGSQAERTTRDNRVNVVIEGVFKSEPLGIFNQFPAQIECVAVFEVVK